MNKLKYLLLFSLTLLIWNQSFYSQEKGTLRGIVIDSTNSEALPFGNVLVRELGLGASTNNRGYFVIRSIPANQTYTLLVSYVGYKTKSFNVKVEPDKITELEVRLVPSSIQLQTIEKVEYLTEEENVPDISKTTITPKQIEYIPKGVESDLLRALASLPGVQSTGDVSAKFNVRGGESNQNLVLFDGIPVYYPFHSIGLFSVIDPDIINNGEFYRGGFSANYGRALSSILKIITKDGNKNNFAGSLSASLLSAKALIEGPIPEGSFYITARKSISNDVLKKFVNEEELPVDFYDASFKINYGNSKFFSGTKFSLHGLFSRDNLKYNDPGRPDYIWANNIIGLKIFAVGEVPFFLDLGITYSNYKNELLPKESDIKPKLNDLSDFSITADFLYVLESKDELGLGIDVKSVTSKLFLINRFDFKADVGLDKIGSNAFINYKFLRFENIGIDLGARFNIKNLAAKGDFVEPRFSFNYLLLPQISLKGSAGIYQQELTTIIDEREVLSLFDPVVIIPGYLEKSKAAHYIIGISTKPANYLSLDAEGFYKKIFSAPTLNENKSLYSEPDLLKSTGESYGGELIVNLNFMPVEFAASYTRAWAFKEVNGVKYSPRYDSRHNLNLSFTYHLPDEWRFSTNWIYHSGFPYTQQIGFYDKLSINDILNEYNIYETLLPINIFGEKNAARLTDYHRLDIILSKRFNLNLLRINLDISAINVYNRKNIYYFEQTTGKRVNMLPFLLTGTLKIEL
ncbi:MAG: TonB-dependent receptor [Bacteroidota bacterium]